MICFIEWLFLIHLVFYNSFPPFFKTELAQFIERQVYAYSVPHNDYVKQCTHNTLSSSQQVNKLHLKSSFSITQVQFCVCTPMCILQKVHLCYKLRRRMRKKDRSGDWGSKIHIPHINVRRVSPPSPSLSSRYCCSNTK